MATVIIQSFPYTFVSTGTQDDTILFRGDSDLVLTAFATITTAGTLQFSVGSPVGNDSSIWDSDSDIPPIGFGGSLGELHVKASGAAVECELSFA